MLFSPSDIYLDIIFNTYPFIPRQHPHPTLGVGSLNYLQEDHIAIVSEHDWKNSLQNSRY